MINIILKVLEFIYPPRCVFCNEIIEVGKSKLICDNCKNNIRFIEGDTCLKCGKPLNDNEEKTCKQCLKYDFVYKKGISLLCYEGFARDAIHRFKYKNHPEYAKIFAQLMYDYSEDKTFFNANYLIPIPMFIKKKKSRGFNQAELIANEFSKISNIPVLEDVLIRIKKTKKQSDLNFKERQNNIKDAFKVERSDRIKNKNILLIDDIYTTGSTINECSKILLDAGARDIYFYSLSIVLYKNKNKSHTSN